MDITLTTPALLFPALSLLMLAYTNRFLALASLIRTLHAEYQQTKEEVVKLQIESLRRRLNVIKQTQTFGVAGFFGGVLSMVLSFVGGTAAAAWMFGASLVLMLISLALSLKEVYLSLDTLSLLLDGRPSE